MVRTLKTNDGKTIPTLGYGFMGTSGKGPDEMFQVGKVALDAGLNHIDSAQIYRTETQMGRLVKESGRKDIWTTTKIWVWRDGNPTSDPNAPKVRTNVDDVRGSVKASLDRIGFIPDLLLIHKPSVCPPGEINAFWKVLESLVEDGTLKGCSLGVSNFTPQYLGEILKDCKIKPAVNQMEYHPYVLAHIDGLLELQAKHGILTQAYGPLTPLVKHSSGGPVKPVVERIAKKLSEETGQEVDGATVLLLWTMTKGVIAISGSVREANIRKMAASENIRDLTQEEVKEIDEAGRKVYFRAYDEHMADDFPVPNLPADA